MKKTLLILFILSALSKLVIAQDFPYGTVSQGEMDMKTYPKDTAAHAVVLQEFGTSKIAVGRDDNLKIIFEYHVKIKLFDSKSFDYGTVEIPVYNNRDVDFYEIANSIKAVTHYKDNNGLTQKIELQTKNIFPVKESKHLGIYKFALPGLKDGCVIEYTYTIESPNFETFHPWQFQSEIPKIYSEYDVHIPGFWNYNASMRGVLKLTKNTSVLEPLCFSAYGAHCDCSFISYGMANVPAFVAEDYMTSPNNFESSIHFELVSYKHIYDGGFIKVTKDWKDVDYQLKSDPDFGDQLKREGLLRSKINPVIADKTDELSKAKAVYSYLQKWFKWNNHYGIFSAYGISKALDTHSGGVADINISLVAALKAAGLNADAVLLSIRDNGTVNTLYPVIADFDYVIAKVDIGGQSYFLDATDPLLDFGLLPLRCLNDKGRVMSLDKPSYWIDLNLSQKEKSTSAMDLTLQENGKLKGTITNYSVGYDAYKKRTEIKKFNSVDEYVEELNSTLQRVKILKSEITGMDSTDKPVCEKYEVEIDLYNKSYRDKLSFNPFFMNRITENPFKLADRSYPVDLGMPWDERVILTMHLPDDYTIETPPQMMAITMPNNGGKFMTSYEPDGNSFTFSNVIQFNKGVYTSKEYPYLKELYNKIIQSEKSEMVFEKK